MNPEIRIKLEIDVPKIMEFNTDIPLNGIWGRLDSPFDAIHMVKNKADPVNDGTGLYQKLANGQKIVFEID